MKFRNLIALMALLLSPGAFATAVVIDFTGVNTHDFYQEEGMQLSGDHFHIHTGASVWGTGAMWIHSYDAPLLTQIGGGAFNFSSLDINLGALRVTSNLGNLAVLSGAGTYALNWNNVSWVRLQGNSSVYLDNLTVNAAAVPAPAALALLGLGLVGMGFARRRVSA